MGEARDSDQVWQITGIEREELANGGGGRWEVLDNTKIG